MIRVDVLFMIVLLFTEISQRYNSLVRVSKAPLHSASALLSSLTGSGNNDNSTYDSLHVDTKNRPYSLPPGQFRPKQSLGQNYLSDQNYVLKIVDTFDAAIGDDKTRVVEIGPGLGALTRELIQRYPNMDAIEIDQRAVSFLNEKMPSLNVKHQDVLQTNWPDTAAAKGGRLNIIANLPYYITSQVLFSLADSHRAINKAVVTMQLEVAERITAKPSTKQYGIPSVVFQLYGATKLNFKIPPKVFYPVPKVDSALITIDFTCPHPELETVNGDQLRRVVSTAFRQRRKMLRQSLKELLLQEGVTLSDKWATHRPEQLSPVEFLWLTKDIFKHKTKDAVTSTTKPEFRSRLIDRLKSRQERKQVNNGENSAVSSTTEEVAEEDLDYSTGGSAPFHENTYRSKAIWRKKIGDPSE